MVNEPALRLRGRGDRIRLRRIGRWNRDPIAELAAVCRTTVAVDKALGESIRAARQTGHSWSQIASALGLPPHLSSWEEVSASLAAHRRAVWEKMSSPE